MVDLYILDKDLNTIGIIDDYSSLIWATRYNDIGDCEVYVQANQRALNLLIRGNYITRLDDDMICRIEKVELDTDIENGNYLIVTAYDCKKILKQRIIWTQTNFNGTVENFIRQLISENLIYPNNEVRKINYFVMTDETNGFTDTIEEQVSYANLGEKVIELCKTFQYGFKVVLKTNASGINYFLFSLYKGEDRSDSVIFSPEFENLLATTYVNDGSGLTNFALIGGEGEGAERKLAEAFSSPRNPTGMNRFEMFVDAKDLSTKLDDGVILSPSTYFNNLRTRGLEQLSEHQILTTFEGSIESDTTFKLNQDYFLGDIVSVENEYGIGLPARITEIVETIDENGRSVEPKFEYMEV